MNTTFDFNALKKKHMRVILPDAKKTTLLVTTPNKSTFDSFVNIKNTLDADMGDEAINELYDILTKILNQNINKLEFSIHDVAEMFDFEDIIAFIKAYTQFISEVTGSKN